MTGVRAVKKHRPLMFKDSLTLLPSSQVQITPQDAMVTMDHRMDRVRLLVDQANKVVRAPKRG
jgi:hypothetical protein